ncbi:MAG: metallophosphoesterase [Candidatus Binatia bacterium]
MAWLGRLRATVTRIFFRSFFRSLLIAVSAAQWTVVAWVLAVGLQVSLAWPLHLVAIAGIYAVNRHLTAGRGPMRAAVVFRTYAATAFVSLFCAMFLGLAWIAFSAVDGVLGIVSAQAFGAAGQQAVQAGVGDAFRWTGSLGMGAIALLMGYGYIAGQHELRVTRLPVPVRGLGRPLRVAQISDIHIGQNLSRAQLVRFVDEVNATAPDLVCITGDIADSPQADLDAFFPLLGRLRARHGVCAILGNHDHGAGADRVVAALRRWTAFHVLRDAAITIDCDGASLHVIGLDDRGKDWARGISFDPQLAELLAAAPADVPVLLLAHRPDIFAQAAAAGVPLTLAGHTHGGQLALPWFGGRRRNLAEFVTAFHRGLFRRAEAHLYVNSGLGVTGQRIRLFTPREITLAELRPA